MSAPRQDREAELAFQQQVAAAQADVRPTPPAVIERYRRHAEPALYSKELLFALIERCRPQTVLDLGCGDGETAVELAAVGYRTTGLDLSPDLIALARRRADLDGVTSRCTFVAGELSQILAAGGRFDLVLLQNVLHHLVDLGPVLAELRQVLAPGGHLLLTEPVSFSATLRLLRGLVPVRRDISPNECQLRQADLRRIGGVFPPVETHYFHLLSRLYRVIPEGRRLRALDAWLLRRLPPCRHFAGSVVMLCRNVGE